jgi:hypothetical protein
MVLRLSLEERAQRANAIPRRLDATIARVGGALSTGNRGCRKRNQTKSAPALIAPTAIPD